MGLSGHSPRRRPRRCSVAHFAWRWGKVIKIKYLPSHSSEEPIRGKDAYKTIDGKPVPSDLVWLAERNAMAVTAIFKLMNIARESGKRLSDVVAVTKHALQNCMAGSFTRT